jgi:hypothetical protein
MGPKKKKNAPRTYVLNVKDIISPGVFEGTWKMDQVMAKGQYRRLRCFFLEN